MVRQISRSRIAALHDNRGNVNIGLDALVRQDAASVDVDFVTNSDVVSKDSYVLETCPSANGAVPANDRRLDPGMVLDLGSAQEHAALEADTITHNNIGTDSDIRANSAVLSDLG